METHRFEHQAVLENSLENLEKCSEAVREWMKLRNFIISKLSEDPNTFYALRQKIFELSSNHPIDQRLFNEFMNILSSRAFESLPTLSWLQTIDQIPEDRIGENLHIFHDHLNAAEKKYIATLYLIGRDIKLLALQVQAATDISNWEHAVLTERKISLPHYTITFSPQVKNPAILTDFGAWKKIQTIDRVSIMLAPNGTQYVLKEQKGPRHTHTRVDFGTEANQIPPHPLTSTGEFLIADHFAFHCQSSAYNQNYRLQAEKPVAYIQENNSNSTESQAKFNAVIFPYQPNLCGLYINDWSHNINVVQVLKKSYEVILNKTDSLSALENRIQAEWIHIQRMAKELNLRHGNIHLQWDQFCHIRAQIIVEKSLFAYTELVQKLGYNNRDLSIDNPNLEYYIDKDGRLVLFILDFEYYQEVSPNQIATNTLYQPLFHTVVNPVRFVTQHSTTSLNKQIQSLISSRTFYDGQPHTSENIETFFMYMALQNLMD